VRFRKTAAPAAASEFQSRVRRPTIRVSGFKPRYVLIFAQEGFAQNARLRAANDGGFTMSRSRILIACVAGAPLILGACASLQGSDPLQVTVAGIEPLQGQGMELRLMVKLRVQNPNDAQIDYNGVALTMDVQGNSFASGVSSEAGSVPRFGESVISVPVTISAFRMLRQAVGMMHGGGVSKISYEMKGKLSGSTFSTHRFSTKGEFEMPTTPAPAESL
jgi:LEA14-like dessication related protein